MDREALDIIFGISRFYSYVFGRYFTLITDRGPLTRIFIHNRASLQMTTVHFLRSTSFPLNFDFMLGKENGNADCLCQVLSCQKVASTDILINEEVNHIYSESIFANFKYYHHC